jgi:hypothetical protein
MQRAILHSTACLQDMVHSEVLWTTLPLLLILCLLQTSTLHIVVATLTILKGFSLHVEVIKSFI